ncbi:MAG: glycosyltransferase family 2 protein [Clostridia bacterium]|nr:glycosyltransferase family 2 protein [Clostridia bacterium]
MEQRTAAVVVTYNRIDLLQRCMDALLAQTTPCTVLLVDNASTDGTGEWAAALAKENDRVLYRNTGSNLGGAGGFNMGMRWALEEDFDFIWLMDDDTLPQADALQKLLEADARLQGNYGWLSGVALWTDGRECKMNRQKVRKDFYEYSECLEQGILRAEQATFVSLFLRKEAALQAGLPIREFFIWGDDIEYTRRISVRLGRPCFVAGQSRVVHAMAQNTGSSIAIDDAGRISRYNYAFRNENYLYRKEGLRGFCYYFAKCGINFLRVWGKAKDHRLHRSWIIVKNLFGGLFFNPKTEYVKK